jgi:hypothetical protein
VHVTEIDLPPDQWVRRPGDAADLRLRMQVVGVTPADPPTDTGWVWVQGWRFLDNDTPAPDMTRELVRATALPPELRPAP